MGVCWCWPLRSGSAPTVENVGDIRCSEGRLPYPAQILFLFLQSLPTTLLGALITFAPAPLYLTYVEAQRVFSISAVTDQELAGLIMWMPGGMIYLVALTVIFFTWISVNEQPYDSRVV